MTSDLTAAPAPVNEYRIEKLRTPVTVVLTGGERIAGDLFVSAFVLHRNGPEHPLDVLNAPEPFLPLGQNGDETLILAKSRVAEIEIDEPPPATDPTMTGVRPTAIEVTLVGRVVRSGFLHLAVRSDRPRLLDYLNSITEPFLLMYGLDGVRILNRTLIERVRPLD